MEAPFWLLVGAEPMTGVETEVSVAMDESHPEVPAGLDTSTGLPVAGNTVAVLLPEPVLLPEAVSLPVADTLEAVLLPGAVLLPETVLLPVADTPDAVLPMLPVADTPDIVLPMLPVADIQDTVLPLLLVVGSSVMALLPEIGLFPEPGAGLPPEAV